eukprot:760053-Prymnesium_polylepis.1
MRPARTMPVQNRRANHAPLPHTRATSTRATPTARPRATLTRSRAHPRDAQPHRIRGVRGEHYPEAHVPVNVDREAGGARAKRLDERRLER